MADSLLVLDIGTRDDAPYHWMGRLEPAMEIIIGYPRVMRTSYPTDPQNQTPNPLGVAECPLNTVSARICKGAFHVVRGGLVFVRDETPQHHASSAKTLMQTLFDNDWTPRLLTHNEVVDIKHGDIVITPMEGYEIPTPLPETMRVYIFIKGTINKKTRDLIDAAITSFRANLAGFVRCVAANPGIPRFVLSETSNDSRLRTTRCLAFAMGLHSRLGSKSQIPRRMDTHIAALVAAML
jgi:hypothetical protein